MVGWSLEVGLWRILSRAKSDFRIRTCKALCGLVFCRSNERCDDTCSTIYKYPRAKEAVLRGQERKKSWVGRLNED